MIFFSTFYKICERIAQRLSYGRDYKRRGLRLGWLKGFDYDII